LDSKFSFWILMISKDEKRNFICNMCSGDIDKIDIFYYCDSRDGYLMQDKCAKSEAFCPFNIKDIEHTDYCIKKVKVEE